VKLSRSGIGIPFGRVEGRMKAMMQMITRIWPCMKPADKTASGDPNGIIVEKAMDARRCSGKAIERNKI
jgi:hypothetical protein